jgi:hypothetical protein
MESDRRYTGVCQRMLSCVVSTAPMEALTGDTIGGVHRCKPLPFIIYLGHVTGSSHMPPGAAARSTPADEDAVDGSGFTDVNPWPHASILDTAAASHQVCRGRLPYGLGLAYVKLSATISIAGLPFVSPSPRRRRGAASELATTRCMAKPSRAVARPGRRTCLWSSTP